VIIFDDITKRRFVARLDPRVRLACVVLFAVLICLAEQPLVLGTGLTAAAALLAVSGVGARSALRRLTTLNVFMLLVAATMPLFIPGRPAFRLGGLTWSVPGFSRALLMASRANAVMLMLIALLGTMEAAHLGFALKGLGVPEKFAHLLLFMVRYIDVIHHEYHHLRDAMLLRAFRPRFDRHTFRAFGFLVGQLLVRSVRRSERIIEAMKCRGFHGCFYILTPCRIERADVAFAIAALAALTVLGIREWM
jgi:cobalt/nickel transport system permease protein